jgi:hypothetical protein
MVLLHRYRVVVAEMLTDFGRELGGNVKLERSLSPKDRSLLA